MNKILVVEDDPIMLKAIGNILTKSGYEITIAKNGKEAFEKLASIEFDLVLTDLMMPFNNGLEIVEKSRKLNTPVIVVSSVGSEDIITECFKLGISDFLKKPIMAAELLARIRKVLKDDNPKLSL